jgi:hypothetical protein
MGDILRVGVIGCGAIAQVMHIPYLVDEPEKFELVALSDVHQPTLDAVGDHYRIPARYTEWRDLLHRDDLDAVVICHNGSHFDSTMAVLEAGKHIFVEKPLAWNVRETEAIAARAAQSDKVLQLGYHKLYDPGFAVAKQQVDAMHDLGFARITVLHPANELGLSPFRIRRGNGVIQEGHVDPGLWDDQVKGQLAAFSGGALEAQVVEVLGARKDNAALRLAFGVMNSSLIHQVYTLFGFLGAPLRVVSTDIWRDGLSIHVQVEYPGDLRVTLDWHFLSHLKDYREEYAFFGNRERVMMQLPSPYFRNFPSPVIVQGGDGELSWEKKIVVSYEEAFRNELLAFHANVTQKRTPHLSSIHDAVLHARFIQQMTDAVRV